MDVGKDMVLSTARVQEGLEELQERLNLSAAEVQERAEGALREMWSVHDPFASGAWRRFGNLLTRRYTLRTNPDALARAQALDREHPLIFLFSHRSYLDGWLLMDALRRGGISLPHALAGANLNFWPMGPVLRRTGALFIRRETKDDPIYRFMLRAYIHHLLDGQKNLGWSIEGGRTRTGKLRPPRFGALRYVVDALRASPGPEAYAIPVSVVYDQLGEVATMASEALGEGKRPEDVRWLLRFSALQLKSGGMARVDIGEPLPLRERIEALDADEKTAGNTVERVALEVCHRINRVTPATPTAVVTVALLGEERALTLREVKDTLQPIFTYLASHPQVPASLDEDGAGDEDWIQSTLDDLVRSEVVERYDGGDEPVYRVAAAQHLVAAFYRNTLIHFLVNRAIGELAMFLVRGRAGNLRLEIWNEALRLRDLLKFEFFFAPRREFQAELLRELDLIDPGWEGREAGQPVVTAERLGLWFERSQPHLAHLVLRPFVDAYLVVARELSASPADAPVDKQDVLRRSLGLGRQWVLQKKLHSAESVTLELFRNAIQLAEHRGLLGEGADVAVQRAAFVEELEQVVDALRSLAAMRRSSPALAPPDTPLEASALPASVSASTAAEMQARGHE